MAITVSKPAHDSYIYAGVPNDIEWTGTTGTTLVFSVKVGDGAYVDITSDISDINYTAKTAKWTPDESLLGVETEVLATFKVYEDPLSGETDTFNFRILPFTSIRPNEVNNKIYYTSAVNIVWSEFYVSSIYSVKLEISIDSSWFDIISATPNTGSYVWNPSNNPAGALSFAGDNTCKIRITSLEGGHEVAVVEGGEFIITTTLASGNGEVLPMTYRRWS
jgi:hypothetical protein